MKRSHLIFEKQKTADLQNPADAAGIVEPPVVGIQHRQNSF